MMQGYNKELTR